MSIEAALTTIRDSAYINQAALAAVLVEAQGQFDAMRLWPDSPTKRELLNQLASTIAGYRQGGREANDLYIKAEAALASVLDVGDPVPPLPDTGGPGWSVEEW